MVKKRLFGYHPSGIPVYAYEMSAAMPDDMPPALTVTAINYGAILNKVVVNFDGKPVDVIGGFDSVLDYIDSSECQGSIAGRVCNRLTNSEYYIDGVKYRTTPNEGKNVCHGGRFGFNQKIWNAEYKDGYNPMIIFTYLSPDGEEGFPGNLSVRVEYQIIERTGLRVHITAKTDKRTIVNLTNHSYFNLNGYNNEPVNNLFIKINADKIVDTDSALLPNGIKKPVENTDFDLRSPRKLDYVFNSDDPKIRELNGLDTCYIFNDYENDGKAKLQAALYNEDNGLKMEVITDQSSVQIYSANNIKSTEPKMKNGVEQKEHFGICFETSKMPDSINHEDFDDTILDPGETYEQYTVYKFSKLN